MGVAISLYTGLRYWAKDYDETDDEGVYLHNLEDFQDHSELVEGVYSYEEYERFMEASYSGYNRFRQAVAESLGYPKYGSLGHANMRYTFWPADSTKPFELIFRFADNEGHWDHECCKSLHKDMLTYFANDYELDEANMNLLKKMAAAVKECAEQEDSAIVFS